MLNQIKQQIRILHKDKGKSVNKLLLSKIQQYIKRKYITESGVN